MRDMEVALNKSGYYDDTANKAITRVMRSIDAHEGEIWELEEQNGPFTKVLVLKPCEDFCEVVMLRRNPMDKRDCEIEDMHFDASRIAYIHKQRLSALDKQIAPEEFKRCMVEIARSMRFDVYLKGVPCDPTHDVNALSELVRKGVSTDVEAKMLVLIGEIRKLLSGVPQKNTAAVPEGNKDALKEEHDARVKAETEAQIYKQLNETLMRKLLGDVA